MVVMERIKQYEEIKSATVPLSHKDDEDSSGRKKGELMTSTGKKQQISSPSDKTFTPLTFRLAL